MSVAFRRESDEAHLEPKFEIPLPLGPNLVTPRGLALIEARVAQLEAAAVPADVQRDLRYWRTRLATAQLMPPATGDEVAFGTRVTFRLNGAARTIALVGDDEADPAAGLLAFTAPLAHAMLGAEPGEMLDFGSKPDAIGIIAVEPI